MTEDRLTHLLAEAADLAPSEALRGRVADLRPEPRRTPWLALSAATGALVAVALALTPRESAAESLLDRAANNGARVSARLRDYAFVGGAWRLDRSGIVARGWMRFDERSGSLEIDTPQGRYLRSGSDGPVFRSDASPSSDDGLTLAGHIRFLKRLGYRTTVASSPPRVESGRTVEDVTIDLGERHERETVTLDAKTELPVRFLKEALLRGAWTPQVRMEAVYPGPQPGSSEFWTGVDRSRIVDVADLTRLWARRLSPVLQPLRLSGGATLRVRDLRILPSGDVLILYTGPANLFARLTGGDGTRFGRVNFDPNDGRTIPRNRPPIMLDGEPLRGFWFAPLEEGRRARGRVRLALDGGPPFDPDQATSLADMPSGAVGQRGAFTLKPLVETSDVPAWADAIDNRFLQNSREGSHDDMRLTAAYDHWLDERGDSIEGTFRDRPVAGWWIPDAPPRPGLRHDPKASAAAAEAFRTMMAHAEAEGHEINPVLVEGYLPRFEREARGG